MNTIKLINRKTKKVVFEKELYKIASIKTTYKEIIIKYHNGLSEHYKKAYINIVME